MNKRILKSLKWTGIYLISTFLFLEALLWIMGYRPYTNHDYHVETKPSHPYIADNTLGIRLNPGSFKFTLNEQIHFEATHLANGYRFVPNIPEKAEKKIVFLGCSYTYGYGVNDSESFPARIQSRLSDWKVENHAVVGYGTAQHWLQLQSLIERSQPDMVILSFSSVHFIRTILDQKYRANLKIGYRRSNAQVDERMQGARFPYFDGCKTAPKYASWETMYTEFPGRYWSASLNFIHGILERNRNASCDPVEVTACLIQEMHELCKKRNISFAVVCLNSTHETKKLEAKLDGVNWKNVGFSFKRRSWTHLPYDSHPNANGHQFIANVVFPFLNALMYEAN